MFIEKGKPPFHQRRPGNKPRTKVRNPFAFDVGAEVSLKAYVLRPCTIFPCCVRVSLALSFRLDRDDGLTRA